MMHKYIKEIIEKQGRLILPDLGAFLTKDVDDKKVLFFNDVLKYNDGTLSGFIAEKEGIDKDEAQKKVTNYIDDINNALVSESKFEIADLGMLYKDQKGYINFKPVESDINEEIKEEIETKVEPVVENIIETTTPENEDMLEIVTDSDEISNIKQNEEEIIISEITTNDEILEIESENTEEEKIIEKIVEEKIIKEEPIIEESKEVILNTGGLVEFNNEPDSNINENKNTETPELTEKTEKVEEKKVKTPEAKKPAKDKKVIEKELHKTANQKTKKSLKPLIIAALIIVPIIILGVIGFVFKEKVMEIAHGLMGKTEHKKEIVEVKKKVTVKENETTTVTDSTITDSNGKTEEIQTETVTKTEEAVETEKVAETPVKEEKQVVAEKQTTTVSNNNSENLKFHAIAASFTNTKDAEKYMKKLIEKGYNSRILDSGNGKIRVSYNSFATRQEAVDEISKLSSQGLQSWVLNQ